MGVVLAPIVDGKLDAWKQWAQDLSGAHKQDTTDFNRRYGLTRHAAWIVETPAGPAVIALHEGPGADDLMQKLGPSQHQFDILFKDKIKELHGMDLTQPPPGPMPELYFDSGS